MRFANAIFEPLWNRRYVDHVELTVAESLGVGHRGTFYESAGALRDIVQNHLLQVLAVTAMEPPASFEADAIRDEKVKLLKAIRPLQPWDLPQLVVRGQYIAGVEEGEAVEGYRDGGRRRGRQHHRDLPRAPKLEIDNWRWAGVPFFVRTGKRLARRVTEVAIRYKQVPFLPLPKSAVDSIEPNTTVMRIQPDEGIEVSFGAKVPGSPFQVKTVDLDFSYLEAFDEEPPEAYERVIFDALPGRRHALHPQRRGDAVAGGSSCRWSRRSSTMRCRCTSTDGQLGTAGGRRAARPRGQRPLEDTVTFVGEVREVESVAEAFADLVAAAQAAVDRALGRFHRGGELRRPADARHGLDRHGRVHRRRAVRAGRRPRLQRGHDPARAVPVERPAARCTRWPVPARPSRQPPRRTTHSFARATPIDLVHLGLGPDGHTASLFPEAATLSITDRLVVSAGDDAHPHPRLTFTYPAIARSPLVVFTVAGEEKREAFARVRNGDEAMPATSVQADQIIWLADQAALG